MATNYWDTPEYKAGYASYVPGAETSPPHDYWDINQIGLFIGGWVDAKAATVV